MKQLMLFLLLSIGLNAQNKVGNFKVSDNKIIWQKVYNKSLNINSQIITLRDLNLPRRSTNFWIKSIRGAKLKVEKKVNKTRLTVSDIYSIPRHYFTFGWFFGVEQNITPKYIEEKYLMKQNFKEKFIKEDAKFIDQIIQREIKSLFQTDDEEW
tara:strand:- start:364 stop:825 length:462 start_codon:yes stop_codon:yes gene_type:complete